MHPCRRRYFTMLKYFLVLSVLTCLVSIYLHSNSKQNSEDQRAIEDHGGICGQLEGFEMSMCELRQSLVGDKVLTLPNDVTANKRILVIGDVHGCLRELTQLLREAKVLKSNDLTDGLNEDSLVVFVGDLVNKGPKSIEVLDFASKTRGVYTVLGNHECYWKLYKKDIPQHIDYLNSLPYVISIPRHNALIVHAGLYHDVPISKQNSADVVHMRNMVPQVGGGYEADMEDTDGVHWATLWKGPQHVYYGHDARRGRDEKGNPRVQRFPFVTGLDTRCVKGGALTGVILPVEKEEFYSVKCPIKYSN